MLSYDLRQHASNLGLKTQRMTFLLKSLYYEWPTSDSAVNNILFDQITKVSDILQ